jgi:hypothetical protein
VNYCLDDLSFKGFLDISSNPSRDIDELVDLVDQLMDYGEFVTVPDCMDAYSIGKGLIFEDLYSFDFSDIDSKHNIDRDQLLRLVVLRGKLESIPVNEALFVTTYNKLGLCVRPSCLSDTAAIINANTEDNEHFTLLVMMSDSLKSGEYEYHVEHTPRKEIYILHSKDNLPSHTRWFIQKLQMPESDFFSLWTRAFPLLLKSDDLSFQRFNGDYDSLRNDVIKHLGFLNDYFLKLWQECNMDFFSFMRKAKSEHGIDFSNESVKTRKSHRKMKKREAMFSQFSQKPVICEIHTKISPTTNRIHIHPPKVEIDSEKILIGIFVDHLET